MHLSESCGTERVELKNEMKSMLRSVKKIDVDSNSNYPTEHSENLN